MPQVSRRVVRPDVQEKILGLFIGSIAKISEKSEILPFVSDLLTPTERTMIAKRLTIAFFLLRGGYDHRTIGQVLKVSTSTVARVNYVLKTQGEGYRNVLKKVLLEENIKHLLKELDKIFPKIPVKGTEWGLW